MKANYQGSTHKSVDTRALVWKIADKARELNLQQKIDNRTASKAVPDLRALGRQKFASASLATFNKKMRDFIAGKAEVITEDDELAPVPAGFGQSGNENEDDDEQGN